MSAPRSSRPHVLLLSPSAAPGGAERILVALARDLPDRGFATSAVVLEQGPLLEWLAEVGCPTTVVRAGRMRWLPSTAVTVARLAALLRRSGADIVVSNQSKGHLFGGVAAWAARRPALWWQHGIPAPEWIDRAAARVPAALVVCGIDEAVEVQRALTPGRRVCKVVPGVPVDQIADYRGTGRAIREHLGWAEGVRVVGIVGRLQPWKGQRVFLEAAALVGSTRPDVRFAVVGGAVLGWEGSYPDELRQMAHQLGLGTRVHFAGHQSDVYPWYDALDVVVHASAREPFGLVLVEAMALGRPLVAAAAGGPMEVVEDGVSGLLVPPGDPAALAQAVGRVLDDPVLAATLGEGGRARASKFSEEQMVTGFAQLLGPLARGARGASRVHGRHGVRGTHGRPGPAQPKPTEVE